MTMSAMPAVPILGALPHLEEVESPLPWASRDACVAPMAPPWMSPAAPDEGVRVVMTTMSSVRPRSIPPHGRSPSMPPIPHDHGIDPGSLGFLPSPEVEELTQRLEAVTAELRDVVEGAAEAVRAARRQALETSEESLVRLAFAIATRVIGREASADPAIVREWTREGIAALGAEDTVEVHVAPSVAAHLGEMSRSPGLPRADVIVDEALESTQIEIRGRYGRVDVGLHARLASMQAALGVDEVP